MEDNNSNQKPKPFGNGNNDPSQWDQNDQKWGNETQNDGQNQYGYGDSQQQQYGNTYQQQSYGTQQQTNQQQSGYGDQYQQNGYQGGYGQNYNNAYNNNPYAPQPKTNGKSIASLVLGICSIVLPYIGVLIGIVGIIISSMSLKEIKATNEQGRGMTLAGLICSIIGTLIWGAILLFVIIVVIFALNAESSSNFYY